MKRSLDIAAIALDVTAVARIRDALAPRPDRPAIGLGPLRHVVNDAAGALFYRVYLSRNLVIVAAGAIFLFSRLWVPLAVLVTATAALPLFDMSVLASNGVTPPAVHPIALALIALTAALLWRRVALGRT